MILIILDSYSVFVWDQVFHMFWEILTIVGHFDRFRPFFFTILDQTWCKHWLKHQKINFSQLLMKFDLKNHQDITKLRGFWLILTTWDLGPFWSVLWSFWIVHVGHIDLSHRKSNLTVMSMHFDTRNLFFESNCYTFWPY